MGTLNIYTAASVVECNYLRQILIQAGMTCHRQSDDDLLVFDHESENGGFYTDYDEHEAISPVGSLFVMSGEYNHTLHATGLEVSLPHWELVDFAATLACLVKHYASDFVAAPYNYKVYGCRKRHQIAEYLSALRQCDEFNQRFTLVTNGEKRR